MLKILKSITLLVVGALTMALLLQVLGHRYDYWHAKYARTNLNNSEELRKGALLFQVDPKIGLSQFQFHDESWEREVDRFVHRKLNRRSGGVLPLWVDDRGQTPTGDISLESGIIRFDVPAATNDELVSINLDPEQYAWEDYIFEVTLRRGTDFRELGLYVRYNDFANRVRYRFEKDRLYFDIFDDGIPSRLHVRPYPMHVGQDYRVRIVAYGYTYRIYVNDELLMINTDYEASHRSGSIAIILWENDKHTPIVASFSDIRVFELVGAENLQ